jgi:type I restriction enzyme S subunit
MEWKITNIGSLCNRVCSGGTPKSTNNAYYNGNIPWLNTKEVNFNRIYDTEKNITQLGLENSSAKWISENSVIVAMYGATAGKVAITKIPITTNQACCNLSINSEIADYNFVYYFLCSKFYELSSLANGGAQQNLNAQIIKDFPIKIPVNLSDQRKIAGILSALDSKIENNNKTNANLEAQAEALFKSWFVDFTPFKDQPFVDSELGPIPQGWKVGKLGDICTFKRGKNLLSKNAIDEGVPVVAGGLSPSCYHNQANTSAPVVTVSGSGANAGFMRMYHVDVWASDCSFIDVSCDYLYFVYCFLSVNRRLLKHAQTGAVQPHVKPADIHDFDVVIPEEDIVKAFQSIIKELLTKVGVNEKENQRLAALRDTLLPKLMSGEIKL